MGTPESLTLTVDDMLTGECVHDAFGHQWKLEAVLSNRGVRMILARCKVCSRGTNYLKHDVVRSQFGTNPHDVTVVKNNGCAWCDAEGCALCCHQCERCRQYRPTDLHHFAPRALFEDADLWPVANLCRECHQYWHAVVTPNLRSNPQPPPPSLRDEWDLIDAARQRLAAHGHHGWDPLVFCPPCAADSATVTAFNIKYRRADTFAAGSAA